MTHFADNTAVTVDPAKVPALAGMVFLIDGQPFTDNTPSGAGRTVYCLKIRAGNRWQGRTIYAENLRPAPCGAVHSASGLALVCEETGEHTYHRQNYAQWYSADGGVWRAREA